MEICELNPRASQAPFLICALAAMLLLAGCTPVAEFARSYDRELAILANERGPAIEYRIGKKAEKLQEQRELVAMVVQLLDELNAGKLPGESEISNLRSEIASEAGLKGLSK